MGQIFVVDDERDVVTLIRFILEKDGHEIVEAYNGAQVLEKLGMEPARSGVPMPDLMILDVMMPEVDGYTVASRMQENPDTRAVPLIILTAKGQMREVFQMSPNVKAYIDKPFDPKNLRELVTSVLNGSQV
jgi:CheY-like chemotaxis protein